MKKYKKSVILGKFLPFHFGHKYLIDSAINQSETVIVLCCTLKREPIEGRLRYSWMLETYWEEICSKKIELVHIDEDLPQHPQEHPEFWSIWKRVIEENSKCKIEAFFTSEKYGDDLAKIFNCDHICVDIERKNFPISGTEIRNSPIDKFNFVQNSIKFYYTKKIVINGPESVGKSTYCLKLAEELRCPHVEEFGRTWYEKIMLDKDNFTYQDISIIAGGQLGLEQERFEKNTSDLLICDTDLVSTEIFSYFFFGKCPQWIKEHNRRTAYHLTFLLYPNVDYIQDGTRVWENRILHYNLLYEFYKNSKRPFVVIDDTDHENRYQRCLKIIKNNR